MDDLAKIRVGLINSAVDRMGKTLARITNDANHDVIVNSSVLLKIALVSLVEISEAVGKLAAVAEADFNEAVQAEVRTRADELADEKVKEQSKRSFIGKKDA